MSARHVREAENGYTAEEFFKQIKDWEKADLIDGVVYMAPPDTPREDEICYLLRFLMRGCCRYWQLGGEVHGSRVAFVLGRWDVLEPDLSFVSADRTHLILDTHVQGAPDIAVEIVTDESLQRDYETKKLLYEEAGVREYWIADPLQQQCRFYRLSRGRFVEVPLEGGRIFRSEVLPGFWLDAQWLLAEPLPDEFECLKQVLSRETCR